MILDDENIQDITLRTDVEKIVSAGANLLGLINSILDLSKIEAGKMSVNIETFDLEKLINDVTNTIHPMAVKRGNRLKKVFQENLSYINSDATKIRQVLLNLLSNACKFTQNGEITLEMSATKLNSKPWLMCKVTDTGRGIEKDEMDKLFDAFTQVEAAKSQSITGTGLGLSICRKFCQMLGGDIYLESEIGVGSTFTMIVPCEESAGMSTSSQKYLDHEIKKCVGS